MSQPTTDPGRNRDNQEVTDDLARAPQRGAQSSEAARPGAVDLPAPATPTVSWSAEDLDVAAAARARGVSTEAILRWLGKPAGTQIPSRPRDIVASLTPPPAGRPEPPIVASPHGPRRRRPPGSARGQRERKPRGDTWSEEELGVAATAWVEGVDAAEIAVWLGRPTGAAIRTMLRRIGVINPERRRPPNWTSEEDMNLESWFREGLSLAVIGRRLGRSVTAVRVRLHRLALREGFSLVQIRPWTMRQLALLMGVDNKTVAIWCDQGGLRFTWGWRTPAVGPEGPRARAGRVRLISEEALTDWMENPDTWHLWRVDRITDEGWREHAEGIRFDADWLTVGEVADLIGVQGTTVNDWIHRGLFNQHSSADGRWGPRRIGNGGNWLINLDDLRGFVAPIDRPDPDAMSTRMGDVLDRHTAGCFELEEGEAPETLEALQRALLYAARRRRLNVSTRRTRTALYFVHERAS